MDESAAALVGHRASGDDTVDREFAVLLQLELRGLQRVVRLLVGDPDRVDDVVAEAVARSLPRWRGGTVEDLGAYLSRVAVNLVVRQWRRDALSLRSDHHAIGWTTAPPGAEVVVSERDRTLRAVRRLPPRRRAVVVLRFYEDLPEGRIAEILGIRVGTVKSQLSRALEQLRADLETLDN